MKQIKVWHKNDVSIEDQIFGLRDNFTIMIKYVYKYLVAKSCNLSKKSEVEKSNRSKLTAQYKKIVDFIAGILYSPVVWDS